jgi:dodecin
LISPTTRRDRRRLSGLARCKRIHGDGPSRRPRERVTVSHGGGTVAASRHSSKKETTMAVARVTKITASSKKGWEDAANQGLKRAAATVRGITGLEVVSQKAKVEGGKIVEYRLTMELTFLLE